MRLVMQCDVILRSSSNDLYASLTIKPFHAFPSMSPSESFKPISMVNMCCSNVAPMIERVFLEFLMTFENPRISRAATDKSAENLD